MVCHVLVWIGICVYTDTPVRQEYLIGIIFRDYLANKITVTSGEYMFSLCALWGKNSGAKTVYILFPRHKKTKRLVCENMCTAALKPTTSCFPDTNGLVSENIALHRC